MDPLIMRHPGPDLDFRRLEMHLVRSNLRRLIVLFLHLDLGYESAREQSFLIPTLPSRLVSDRKVPKTP